MDRMTPGLLDQSGRSQRELGCVSYRCRQICANTSAGFYARVFRLARTHIVLSADSKEASTPGPSMHFPVLASSTRAQDALEKEDFQVHSQDKVPYSAETWRAQKQKPPQGRESQQNDLRGPEPGPVK